MNNLKGLNKIEKNAFLTTLKKDLEKMFYLKNQCRMSKPRSIVHEIQATVMTASEDAEAQLI